MSDGESSHHSCSSLESSVALPFEVKIEAAQSQPGTEVDSTASYYSISDLFVCVHENAFITFL